jgi:BirA family biotin operon repressor/biotin-[acetyl-CoA-carboxylase] ligase
MKHEHFQEIDSTQDYLLSRKTTEDYLVSCDKQTKGKGRHGRSWQHQEGSLALSFTLKSNPIITLTALEMAVLVNQYFQNKLLLKWPNDLMEPRLDKCGGILIDIKDDMMIVGIGLNLLPNEDFGSVYPEEREIDPKELSLKIYHHITNHRLSAKDVISEWEKYCCHLNEEVEIDNQEGNFKGIGSNGEALIEIQGQTKSFYTGSLLIG